MKKSDIIAAVCAEFEVEASALRSVGRKPCQQVSDARAMVVYLFDKERVAYPTEVQRMLAVSEGGYRAMLSRARARVSNDAIFRHHLQVIKENF